MTTTTKDHFEIPNDSEILNIGPVKDATKITLCSTRNYYVTPYARLGPFLTSYGRYWLAKFIEPHADKIVRIHTDGIVCTKPIENIKLGKSLGQWKIEHEGDVEVVNKINVKWTN